MWDSHYRNILEKQQWSRFDRKGVDYCCPALNEQGGNNEILCWEIKNQLKESIAQRESFRQLMQNEVICAAMNFTEGCPAMTSLAARPGIGRPPCWFLKPSKSAPSRSGIRTLIEYIVAWAHPSQPVSQTASRSVDPFCRARDNDRQTDRPTDHATRSVT